MNLPPELENEEISINKKVPYNSPKKIKSTSNHFNNTFSENNQRKFSREQKSKTVK